MSAKFKVGDRVTVVWYGNRYWSSEGKNLVWKDLNPEEVGQQGVVREVSEVQGRWQYALEKPGKQAWFNEDQLAYTITGSIAGYVTWDPIVEVWVDCPDGKIPDEVMEHVKIYRLKEFGE